MSFNRIPLRDGGYTLVDDEDLHLLTGRALYRATCKRRITPYANAYRWVKGVGYERAYLHRLILNAPEGLQVDHRNGNGLDNRRSNLRLVTKSENMRNSRRSKTNTTGIQNARWREDRFIVSLHVNERERYIGLYRDPGQAAAVAYEARRFFYGEESVNQTPFPRLLEDEACRNAIAQWVRTYHGPDATPPGAGKSRCVPNPFGSPPPTCKRGHLLSVRPNGTRACKTCRAADERRYKAARRAQEATR